MLGGIDRAAHVDVGAHRFGHAGLIDSLADRLAGDDSFTVRMVADDDLYWLDPVVGEAQQVGDNDTFEADNVARLDRAGDGRFEIRYMETNHAEHLLHHNKYLIYRDDEGRPFATLCGAANLTGTGFWSNFENIYYVRIPEVVDQFDVQFARVWDGRRADGDDQDPPVATPIGRLPQLDAPAF
jgi:hypothetical protein